MLIEAVLDPLDKIYHVSVNAALPVVLSVNRDKTCFFFLLL